jgi:hypothetical protein
MDMEEWTTTCMRKDGFFVKEVVGCRTLNIEQ